MPRMAKLTQGAAGSTRKLGKRLPGKGSEGELQALAADRASALRILMDDDMMRSIADIGCFRVLANEPVAAEPPDPLAGRRLFGIDLVDYASDRSVTAYVDLDRGGVASLRCAPATARLAPEEEAEALSVALADRRVACGIALGDAPQSILHVETRTGTDSHPHRSAAVVFGPSGHGCAPSLVAVVDLARRTVTKVFPAERW
jgi:hypothetical protein